VFRRVSIGRLPLVLAPLALAASLWAPAAATAATSGPVGAIAAARQDTFASQLTVTGWAYDSQRPSGSVTVTIYVDGHYAGRARADLSSPSLDRARHVTGRHRFRFVRTWRAAASRITVVRTGTRSVLDRATATRFRPGPGQRIVDVAKRYVGHARYVEGGASPRSGFDCSGYTQYAYAQAAVRRLPHNAEGQRRLSGMRHIARSAARPGDLVFYLSGGRAFHVAIYAGHGMQYAAATARDGIRYQPIWSRNVEFRTSWH